MPRSLNDKQLANFKRLRAIKEDPNQKLTSQQRQKLRSLDQLRVDGGKNSVFSKKPSTAGGGGAQASGLAGAVGQAVQGKKLQNPRQAAVAQAGINDALQTQQGLLNRPDETDPFSSQRFTIDPVTGRAVVSRQFNEGEQAIHDRGLARQGVIDQGAFQALGQFAQNAGQGLNFGGLPGLTQDFSADRQRIEDNVFGNFMRRAEPEFAQQTENLEQQLANRGIPRGSELFNREMERLSRQQEDAKLSAQSRAFELAGGEQSRLQGFNMGTRQQGISEQLTNRGLPLTDAAGLLSLGRGAQMGSFNPIQNINVDPINLLPFGQQINNQRFTGRQNTLNRESAQNIAHAGFANSAHIAGMNNAAAMNRLQEQLAHSAAQANATAGL